MSKIYYDKMEDAIERNRDKIPEVKARLEAAGVKYVHSCWIDLLGIPKTKPVPMWDFEELCLGKGPQFAVHSVSFVPELGPADPDQIMIPDLDAVYICPWDPTQAIIFADLYWEGAPYNVCPRMALKRQVAEAAEAGYRPMAGVEPEFIVMRYDEDGLPIKAFDVDPPLRNGRFPRRQAWGYDIEATADSMDFLGDLIDILGDLDWDLHDVVCEGAYSQFELDFGYTHAVEMADRLTFLRVFLKEIAKNHGLFVTFMPKVTIGDWRSGAHINYSIQDIKTGENLFGNSKDGWSEQVNHGVGGLLRHGGGLSAITCSTVTSYKGPRRPRPRVRGGRLHLGADPCDLRTQQPLRHAASAAEPVLHREPRRRHVHEHLSCARLHDRRGRPRPGGEDRSGPAARQGPLPDDRAGVRRRRCSAPAAHAAGGGQHAEERRGHARRHGRAVAQVLLRLQGR